MDKAELIKKIAEMLVEKMIIGEKPTNGDVIKAVFADGKTRREQSFTHDRTVFAFPDGTYFGAECRFDTDWWNAPYEGGNGNGYSN